LTGLRHWRDRLSGRGRIDGETERNSKGKSAYGANGDK
jgi:hypothetical protein